VNGYATTSMANALENNSAEYQQELSDRIISQMWIQKQQQQTQVSPPQPPLTSETVKLHNQWVSESKKIAAKHNSSASSVSHFYDPVATTYQDVSSVSHQYVSQVRDSSFFSFFLDIMGFNQKFIQLEILVQSNFGYAMYC
jgi:hypothetical protein